MSEAAAPTPEGQSAPPLSSKGEGGDAVVALAAGTRVAEFEIRRVLGSGGFGIVYLAWDHALEREVALKEYMPGTLADRGEGLRVSVRSQPMADTFALGLRSFINEARMLARFDHPSLVKVYRFWEDNGTAYMVMPCYQGRTLRQVRAGMVVPPGEVACRRVLDALLSALEVLHKEGVYHRDIAPDNILLGDDGLPVLLDFGAARRVIGEGNKALTSIMKPHFAPLEQYADQSAMRQGPWTDLYALGGTIYFLITGLEPVPAASRALHDDQPRLTDLRPPDCTQGFLAAIDWMLALKPPDRPQSVHMLRDVLEGRIAMPVRQAGDRTMPGFALRDKDIDILTGPGDLPTAGADVPPATGGGERTVLMPSAPAPLAAMPEVDRAPSSAPVSAAALHFTRRQSLVVLALLLVLNVLAWWWFARAGGHVDRVLPGLAAGMASTPASAPASEALAAPRPGIEPNETVLSVLPPRVPRAGASTPADAAPLRSTEPIAAAPRSVGDGVSLRPGEPVTTAEARGRTAASGPLAAVVDAMQGPRERCGDRNFLSQLVCMKRECESAALRTHPECVKMREQEEAQRHQR
ncbi:MAG: protein kinase [Aquincola sp.]|nr:protein kinase [Aquincola sp.]MDH5330825.1 protein kinase [Aquincola sp.]